MIENYHEILQDKILVCSARPTKLILGSRVLAYLFLKVDVDMAINVLAYPERFNDVLFYFMNIPVERHPSDPDHIQLVMRNETSLVHE